MQRQVEPPSRPLWARRQRELAECFLWECFPTSPEHSRRLLALLLVVVVGVMMALLVFLVPQIAQLFKTMGMALPGQTKALLAIESISRGPDVASAQSL